MHKKFPWEKHYIQVLIDTERLVMDDDLLDVEELNQIWIDMSEEKPVNEHLDWTQILAGEDYPVSPMSVQELNNIYTQIFAGTQEAKIAVFPAVHGPVQAAQRKLA